MSKAAYWQRGETLDYVNNTGSIIEANTVIKLAERIGIAGTNINPGEKGDIHVCGVFEFAKPVKTRLIWVLPYILTEKESRKLQEMIHPQVSLPQPQKRQTILFW